MIKLFTCLCWIASLVVLTSLTARGLGIAPNAWLRPILHAYDGLSVGFAPLWRDLIAFYLLFGIVEKAVTEWAYAYAGLVTKYQSRKVTAKASRVLGAISGTLLWPVSLALDIIAVLVWHSEAGTAAKEASQQTLRSLRLGLTRKEVEDVVERYGRLTYLARPLFAASLCLSYVIVMILVF